MTAASAARLGVALALLVASAAALGGCGKYGRPVRSAPPEVQEVEAKERGAAGGFEAERPEDRSPEENGEKKRDREHQEQGGAQ